MSIARALMDLRVALQNYAIKPEIALVFNGKNEYLNFIDKVRRELGLPYTEFAEPYDVFKNQRFMGFEIRCNQ